MWRNNKRTIIASVAGLAIVVAIAGVSGAFGGGAAVDVPTTAVIKGEFIDYLQVRGEVKAVRSVALTVPTTGGGDLQILELAKNGMSIKKGDVVVRFDPMTVAAHAERQALRVQTGRGGNRQDARAVPHSGAAGADGPDEGALRRSARGARRRAERISPANGARAEGARAEGREGAGSARPSGS